MTILDEWEVTPEDIASILISNPSLRGMLFGYIAELKLKNIVEQLHDVSYVTKFDDHDREKKEIYILYIKVKRLLLSLNLYSLIRFNTFVLIKNGMEKLK